MYVSLQRFFFLLLTSAMSLFILASQKLVLYLFLPFDLVEKSPCSSGHYKEITKKWLGFMTHIGKKVQWWLASFLVLNLAMSDQSIQTKWLWSYWTTLSPHDTFHMKFWDLGLDHPSNTQTHPLGRWKHNELFFNLQMLVFLTCKYFFLNGWTPAMVLETLSLLGWVKLDWYSF